MADVVHLPPAKPRPRRQVKGDKPIEARQGPFENFLDIEFRVARIKALAHCQTNLCYLHASAAWEVASAEMVTKEFEALCELSAEIESQLGEVEDQLDKLGLAL